jgi:uncharacterized membrane protein YphA (DoxX/SURF4 family)
MGKTRKVVNGFLVNSTDGSYLLYVTSTPSRRCEMKGLPRFLAPIDFRITHWMARRGVVLLRAALGIVFVWFGFLKFFPGLSPVQTLAIDTINVLTFGLMPVGRSIILLASLECVIGLGLISGKFMRLTLLLLAFQMLGAASPLLIFLGEAFVAFPYAPTLEGQYIIKNLVLVSAGIVIGATVRGGRLSADADPNDVEFRKKDQKENSLTV